MQNDSFGHRMKQTSNAAHRSLQLAIELLEDHKQPRTDVAAIEPRLIHQQLNDENV
jgi:hypothetical protein